MWLTPSLHYLMVLLLCNMRIRILMNTHKHFHILLKHIYSKLKQIIHFHSLQTVDRQVSVCSVSPLTRNATSRLNYWNISAWLFHKHGTPGFLPMSHSGFGKCQYLKLLQGFFILCWFWRPPEDKSGSFSTVITTKYGHKLANVLLTVTSAGKIKTQAL